MFSQVQLCSGRHLPPPFFRFDTPRPGGGHGAPGADPDRPEPHAAGVPLRAGAAARAVIGGGLVGAVCGVKPVEPWQTIGSIEGEPGLSIGSHRDHGGLFVGQAKLGGMVRQAVALRFPN